MRGGRGQGHVFGERAHALRVEGERRDNLTQKAEQGGRSPEPEQERAERPGRVISFISPVLRVSCMGKNREEAVEFVDSWWGQRTDCRGLWREGMVKAERQ